MKYEIHLITAENKVRLITDDGTETMISNKDSTLKDVLYMIKKYQNMILNEPFNATDVTIWHCDVLYKLHEYIKEHGNQWI